MSSKKAAKAAKAAKRSAKLVDAAMVGDVETMARVMSSGPKLDLDALVAREGWERVATKEDLPDLRITALYAAVTYGKEAAVRFLLERGANPSLADSNDYTPLMCAAYDGNQPIMRMLMEAKADLDAVGPMSGGTAFHSACDYNRPDCAEALVRAGCDTTVWNKAGETGRELAERKENAAVLARLSEVAAERMGERPAQTSAKEELALIHAAIAGDAMALRAALKGGCELEARDDDGHTAFLIACNKGSAECMQLLVEAGCDTAATNGAGMTALMLAANSGVPAAARLALEKSWCELEARDANGDTAFLIACCNGSAECMQLLADAGCDTAATNDAEAAGRVETAGGGETALICAVQSNVPAAVRLALEKGWGELEVSTKGGYTAFLGACLVGSIECMKILADAGCDTAATNHDNQNALMLAAGGSSMVDPRSASAASDPAAVRMVLESGWCELEARSEGDGRRTMTAFLWACCRGSVECVELLVQAGCDVEAKVATSGPMQSNGLDLALRSGHDAVVRRLRELQHERKTERKAAALKQDAQELIATEQFSEAVDALKKVLRLVPTCAETQASMQKAEAGAAKALARRHRQVDKAEAELMAMLDAETTGGQLRPAEQTAADVEAAAERKRKKRARQRAQKRAAKLAEASAEAAAAMPEPEPELEPEPKPEPKPEPEPEPEPESAEQRAARERSAQLSRLQAVPMAEWSESQVLEWTVLIDLPPGCAEAVASVFAQMDLDGDELASVKGKSLAKRLAKLGLGDPQLVVQTLLRERDSRTAASGRNAGGDATECPLCFERYRDDESGRHVPRILQCGHSACHDCFARMLRPIVADGDLKKLECPECRAVMEVVRGRADSLTKNFALLRCASES
eukprot:COSAG04_NODE_1977_length_5094_cov_11.505105_3_plen_871_part_00